MPTQEPAIASPSRLVSLDAFRGATMALMVLVNDAGDGANVYWPLEHAQWNGWTPTDVVFPSFLWIVGVSMTLAFTRRLTAGGSRRELFLQVLRRALILYLLGLIVYAAPAFSLATQRWLGVLQRIAICYLISAAIYLTTKLRGQLIWIAGLLITYWLLMTLVPVPGFGPGRLDVEGNFAHYVDRIVLGRHNYQATRTWDPEGIISTLPAIATALLGVVCGHVLRIEERLTKRALTMVAIGIALIVAGLLCNHWMPINKKLWTPAFTFFMAGLDFVIFSGFIWVVDVKEYRRFVSPLVIMGLNPIAVYMASELLDEVLSATGWHNIIYSRVFAPIASPLNASLGWALIYTAVMFGIAWALWRRKLILKV